MWSRSLKVWAINAEWVATFFGCVLRGVLPVPVDVTSASNFVERVEREVSPKLIAGDRDKLSVLRSAVPLLFFERLKRPRGVS